jgi:RHS repeat-associated protein
MRFTQRTLYFYDANGNVGQLVAWASDYGGASGYDWHANRLVARYEYDPYGNNLLDPTDPQESGPYATDNPIRFSTKYFDDETALGYWGYRYYTPRLGRWLNRDPIADPGAAFIRRAAELSTSTYIPRDRIGEQMNLYRYVHTSPTNLIDPLGLQTSQPASQPCCYCGPDITDAIIDHLNAFIAGRRGNLSPWPPTGARQLSDIARRNGGRFWSAVTNYSGPCGAGVCKGTVTLCDLCMSGYHIDHIFIMAYIAENYYEWMARSAGETYEQQNPNPPDITAADLAFNDLALCFARAMGPAGSYTTYDGSAVKTVRYPTDYLKRSELCACVKGFAADQREVIANKPGKGSGVTDYEDCIPCDDSISKPGGLELPPLDPY